jgi:hypothetical protein
MARVNYTIQLPKDVSNLANECAESRGLSKAAFQEKLIKWVVSVPAEVRDAIFGESNDAKKVIWLMANAVHNGNEPGFDQIKDVVGSPMPAKRK